VFGEEDEKMPMTVAGGYGRGVVNLPYRMSPKPEAKTKRRAGGGGGSGAVVSAPSPARNRGIVMADKAVDTDITPNLSPGDRNQIAFTSKFHPSVLAVIERLKDKKAAPGADEARFIHNGKAEVQIWLNDKSDETMAALKALGFEVMLDPKTAKMVIGRMPVEKLAALAELKSIRYVGPQL
jgi:hypothetical protein